MAVMRISGRERKYQRKGRDDLVKRRFVHRISISRGEKGRRSAMVVSFDRDARTKEKSSRLILHMVMVGCAFIASMIR